MTEFTIDWDYREYSDALDMGLSVLRVAECKVASDESVATMLLAPLDSNGRSKWMWIRLPNGDLVFGCFPQGDTYFLTEDDHS